jgi:hypothetical protein
VRRLAAAVKGRPMREDVVQRGVSEIERIERLRGYL